MKSDYALTHSRLVMDRWFYNAANVKALNAAGYDFLMPLPSECRQSAVARSFDNVASYFQFNDRQTGHAVRRIKLAGTFCEAHVFVDFRGAQTR